MTEQSEEQKNAQAAAEGLREAAKDAASESAEAIRHMGQTTAEKLKEPTTAAAITGAVVVGAAITFGVLETVVGGTAAYVTYRILRRRREAAAH